jgi:hypothetical protein
MAATVNFGEDNGAALASQYGTGNRGTTRTTGVLNVNWKNIDDSTSTYSLFPITAGSNSYEKFQFLVFTGAYNQVGSVLFQHVTGELGAGFQIKGHISGSGIYTTPSTTTNPNFTFDFTPTGLITTGFAVLVGGSGPEATGKAATSTVIPAFTQYFASQLITQSSVAPGDTVTAIFQLRYTEN